MTQSIFRLRDLSYLLLLGLCLSCGQTAPPSSHSCTPTHSGSLLDLKVTHVSGQHYVFQLCSDSRAAGSPFTVYGATSASGISQPTIVNRYRLSHVADVQRSGDQFEVTFDGDLWFVIFADAQSGGSFVYSTTTEMIRGDLSQSL